MPRKRAVLLTFLACLLAAAPAAASERSEARKYAAAMEPEMQIAPEEAEALVAAYEARAAHVAATCLDAVKSAARRERRRTALSLLYGLHIGTDSYRRQVEWMREADDRLAAIDTSSRTLRRGRAARRTLTRFLGWLAEAGPTDFCAAVTTWQADGFKGAPPGLRAFVDAADAVDDPRLERWLRRAEKALKRHGATRAQRNAFGGVPEWPELREPAPDPVLEALRAQRDDEAGARAPY